MTEQEIRLKSLEWIYLNVQPCMNLVDSHQIWQSPLLFPANLSDSDEFDRRIHHAGQLWLQNHDLRPFNLLILTHGNLNISYVFQRPQQPGELSMSVGPISQSILIKGKPLLPYELIFAEFKNTI